MRHSCPSSAAAVRSSSPRNSAALWNRSCGASAVALSHEHPQSSRARPLAGACLQAADQLLEQGPGGIQVGGDARRPAFGGRHRWPGAQHRIGGEDCRQAQGADADLALSRHHHHLRADIAVDHAGRVDLFQPCQHQVGDRQAARQRQGFGPHQRCEAAATAQLVDHVETMGDADEVVDPHHVGRRQRGGETSGDSQALHEVRSGDQLVGDLLERHGMAAGSVASSEARAHQPLAHHRTDDVVVTHHGHC